MIDQHDPHTGLHSDRGALAGEHPGKAAHPIVKPSVQTEGFLYALVRSVTSIRHRPM
jgi:hypothetical protein